MRTFCLTAIKSGHATLHDVVKERVPIVKTLIGKTLIFGGNHDRTIEMAFGRQTVNFEKDVDNSHLHWCEEVEYWAKDVYDS